MMPFPLPRNLADASIRDERGPSPDWLSTLPSRVRQVEAKWSLTLGQPFQPGGRTAWVAPVKNKAGSHLVLKVGWRHAEAEHEADGLRAWAGQGAVRLYAMEEFDDTAALLLERCIPGTPLAARPEPEQDSVIAGLLSQLWLAPEPHHPFRQLQQMCHAWADEFELKAAAHPGSLDPGLARAGITLLRDLPGNAAREVLLCTDLHAGNVLAADREPWLMVDPKPYVGDPTYDPLQHLLNCEVRLLAQPEGLIRKLADLLGLDAARLRLWLFARCVQESLDSAPMAAIARLLAPD